MAVRAGPVTRRSGIDLRALVAAQGNVNTSSAPAPGDAVWDGLTLSVGDVVMLGRQSDKKQAGAWTFKGIGLAMVRYSRARHAADFYDGMEILVGQGGQDKDTRWRLRTDAPVAGYVLGTTELTFDRISAPSSTPSAQVFSCPAAAAVGDPSYLDGEDSVAAARADATAKAATHVITEKITTTSCRAATTGRVGGLGGLTPAAAYWLGSAGGITTTAPAAGSGDLAQRIGVAASATELDLSIQRGLIVA